MKPLVGYGFAVFTFSLLVLGKFDPQAGFTRLIRFGEGWSQTRHPLLQGLPIATVPQSDGYDGQFYAQIAVDPLLRTEALKQALDAPAYRAGRILVPAFAALFGFGHPWSTLQAYALINVLCWGALGWLLYHRFPPSDRFAFFRWLGCMFSMGVLESVRQSLVDLPALLLLWLAADSYARNLSTRSTAWLSLGSLAKETNLVGALAIQCDWSARPFPWLRAARSIFFCALPLVLWGAYVRRQLGPLPETPALGNFSWPFVSLGRHAMRWGLELAAGNVDSRNGLGLIAIIGLLTQFWWIWRHRQTQSVWWRIGAAYSILFVFLGDWVWSGYWAICRAVLPMTIAFNLTLPQSRAFWPLWFAGNLTVAHAIWRFL